MAVGMHVVDVTETTELGERTLRVVADGGVANSSGSPTVKVYLAAEAADDYLPTVVNDMMVVTINASELNAA